MLAKCSITEPNVLYFYLTHNLNTHEVLRINLVNDCCILLLPVVELRAPRSWETMSGNIS